MQIEGGGGGWEGGTLCPSGPERGRRKEGGEEKGAKRRQWKRGWAQGGEKVAEGRRFVRWRPDDVSAEGV